MKRFYLSFLKRFVSLIVISGLLLTSSEVHAFSGPLSRPAISSFLLNQEKMHLELQALSLQYINSRPMLELASFPFIRRFVMPNAIRYSSGITSSVQVSKAPISKKESFYPLGGPWILDVVAMGIPVAILGMTPLGFLLTLVAPVAVRFGIVGTTVIHENGHVFLALVFPKSRASAWTAANRRGNIPWKAWALSLLPFHAMTTQPSVQIDPTTVTDRQDRAIRWGGALLSLGGALSAALGTAYLAAQIPQAPAFFIPLLIANIGIGFSTIAAVESDFFGPVAKGVYNCGNKIMMSFRKPYMKWKYRRTPLLVLTDSLFIDSLRRMGHATVLRGGHSDKIVVFVKNKQGEVVSISYAVGSSLGGTLEEEAIEAFIGAVRRLAKQGYELMDDVPIYGFTRFATSGNGMDPAFAQGSRWGKARSIEVFEIHPAGLKKLSRKEEGQLKRLMAKGGLSLPAQGANTSYEIATNVINDETWTWFNGDFNSLDRSRIMRVLAPHLGISNADHLVAHGELLYTGHVRALMTGIHGEPYQDDLEDHDKGPDGPVWAGFGRLMTAQGYWEGAVAAAHFLTAHTSVKNYFEDRQLSSASSHYAGPTPEDFALVGGLFKAAFQTIVPRLNPQSADLADLSETAVFQMTDELVQAALTGDGAATAFVNQLPSNERERHTRAMRILKGWVRNESNQDERLRLLGRAAAHIFLKNNSWNAFKLMLNGTAFQDNANANAFGGGIFNTRFPNIRPIVSLGGQPLTLVTDAEQKTLIVASERTAGPQMVDGVPVNLGDQVQPGELVQIVAGQGHYEIGALYDVYTGMEISGARAQEEWTYRREELPIRPEVERGADPIDEGLLRVPYVAQTLRDAFGDETSPQYKVAMDMFRKIDGHAQQVAAMKRVDPDSTKSICHILVCGLSDDDNLGRIFVNLAQYLYPDLNIRFHNTNEIQRKSNLIKGIEGQNWRISPDTIGIVFDQPGQTHTSLNAVKWLIGDEHEQGMGMHDVYLATGSPRSELGDLLDEDHILDNTVGLRSEEPGALAPLGSRVLLIELLTFLYERSLERAEREGQSPYERRAYLQRSHLDMLKARNDVMVNEILGSITGASSEESYNTHASIVEAAERSAWNNLENVIGEFAGAVFLAVELLVLQKTFFYSIYAIIAPHLGNHAYLPFVVLSVMGLDYVLNRFFKAFVIIGIRAIQHKPLLARIASRTMLIADEPDTAKMVARSAKAMTGTSFVWSDHGYKAADRNEQLVTDEHSETRSNSEVLFRMAEGDRLPIDREGHESALSHVLGIQFWIVPQRVQRFLQKRGWERFLPKIGIRRVGPSATVLVHDDPDETPALDLHKTVVTIPKATFAIWNADFTDADLRATDFEREVNAQRAIDIELSRFMRQAGGDKMQALNQALTEEDLFTHIHYHQLRLPVVAEALLSKAENKQLAPRQLRTLNHLLLEACYPQGLVRNPLIQPLHQPAVGSVDLHDERFERLIEEMYNATEGHAAELVFVHAKEKKIANFWLVRLLNPRRIDRSPDVTGVFSTKTNMFKLPPLHLRPGHVRSNAGLREEETVFLNDSAARPYATEGAHSTIRQLADDPGISHIDISVNPDGIRPVVFSGGVQWIGPPWSDVNAKKGVSVEVRQDLTPIDANHPVTIQLIFDMKEGPSVTFATSVTRLARDEWMQLSVDRRSLANKRVRLTNVSRARLVAINATGSLIMRDDRSRSALSVDSPPMLPDGNESSPELEHGTPQYSGTEQEAIAAALQNVGTLFEGEESGTRVNSSFVFKDGQGPKSKRDLIYTPIPMKPDGMLMVRPHDFPREYYEGLQNILKLFDVEDHSNCIVQLVKNGDRAFYQHLGKTGENKNGIYFIPEILLKDAFGKTSFEPLKTVAYSVLQMELAEERLERVHLLTGDQRSREERESLMSEIKIRWFLRFPPSQRLAILNYLKDQSNPYDLYDFGQRILLPAHQAFEQARQGGAELEDAIQSAVTQSHARIRDYVAAEAAILSAQSLRDQLFEMGPDSSQTSTFLVKGGVWPITKNHLVGPAIPLSETGHVFVRPPDMDLNEYEVLAQIFALFKPQNDGQTLIQLIDNPKRASYRHKGTRGEVAGGGYFLSKQMVHDAAYPSDNDDMQAAAKVFLILEMTEEKLERQEMLKPKYTTTEEKEIAFSLAKVAAFLRYLKDHPEAGPSVLRVSADERNPYDAAHFGSQVLAIAYQTYTQSLEQNGNFDIAVKAGLTASSRANTEYVKRVLSMDEKENSEKSSETTETPLANESAQQDSNHAQQRRQEVNVKPFVKVLIAVGFIIVLGGLAYHFNLFGFHEVVASLLPAGSTGAGGVQAHLSSGLVHPTINPSPVPIYTPVVPVIPPATGTSILPTTVHASHVPSFAGQHTHTVSSAIGKWKAQGLNPSQYVLTYEVPKGQHVDYSDLAHKFVNTMNTHEPRAFTSGNGDLVVRDPERLRWVIQAFNKHMHQLNPSLDAHTVFVPTSRADRLGYFGIHVPAAALHAAARSALPVHAMVAPLASLLAGVLPLGGARAIRVATRSRYFLKGSGSLEETKTNQDIEADLFRKHVQPIAEAVRGFDPFQTSQEELEYLIAPLLDEHSDAFRHDLQRYLGITLSKRRWEWLYHQMVLEGIRTARLQPNASKLDSLFETLFRDTLQRLRREGRRIKISPSALRREQPDFLASVLRHMREAAHAIGLSATEEEKLLTPVRNVEVEFSFVGDNGETIRTKGWRVVMGKPGKGGIRATTEVRQPHVQALSIDMGDKTASEELVIEDHLGHKLILDGGKGGFPIDLLSFQTAGTQARAMRAYARAVLDKVWKDDGEVAFGVLFDVPAPDVGTGRIPGINLADIFADEVNRWMVNHYLDICEALRIQDPLLAQDLKILVKDALRDPIHYDGASNDIPYVRHILELRRRNQLSSLRLLACVTGKSEANGGIAGRTPATGIGLVYAAFEYYKQQGWLHPDAVQFEGQTVAVKGMGAVGRGEIEGFNQMNAKVVAVSEVDRELGDFAFYVPRGITLETVRALDEYRAQYGSFGKFARSEMAQRYGIRIISKRDFWKLNVDMSAPSAMENTLTAAQAWIIRAKVVIEGANGPTTPLADRVLRFRGIHVIPDVLANAGGVFVSYLEMRKDIEGREADWTLSHVFTLLHEFMRTQVNGRYAVMKSDVTMRQTGKQEWLRLRSRHRASPNVLAAA